MSASPNPPRSRVVDSWPWGMITAVVLLGLLFWAMLPTGESTADKHPVVGQPGPAFDLVQLIPAVATADSANGADADVELPTWVGQSPENSLSLLHFWGTWCPPCKLEYPELVEMVKEFDGNRNFHFVTVSCGGGGSENYDSLRSQTQRYYGTIAAQDLKTFADLDGRTRSEMERILGEPMAYPTTVLIGPDQRIAGVWLGYTPAGVQEMRQLIKRLLGAAT
jgi:cytochrome c biogenesis protein CcmG/thiol:disulfide interchange protein DsbE